MSVCVQVLVRTLLYGDLDLLHRLVQHYPFKYRDREISTWLNWTGQDKHRAVASPS